MRSLAAQVAASHLNQGTDWLREGSQSGSAPSLNRQKAPARFGDLTPLVPCSAGGREVTSVLLRPVSCRWLLRRGRAERGGCCDVVDFIAELAGVPRDVGAASTSRGTPASSKEGAVGC